jgi:hypothetical protein
MCLGAVGYRFLLLELLRLLILLLLLLPLQMRFLSPCACTTSDGKQGDWLLLHSSGARPYAHSAQFLDGRTD